MSLTPWHALSIDATLSAVASTPDGLSSSEAQDRLDRDGPNILSERRGASWMRKLAEQFIQPLVG
jgi:magnesium-transporting ATPase (P-type)